MVREVSTGGGAPHLTATLRTTDGVRVDARHDPGPTGPGNAGPGNAGPGNAGLGIVVAHGLTGSWRRPAVRRAVGTLTRSAGVVSFDFRGHGRSTGASTVGDREILDLEAAVRWTHALGYQPVATVGFSMGAAVALRHAAAFGGVAAVVAVSGPSRWYYRDTPAMRRVHWVIENRLGRLAGRMLRQTRIATSGWDPVPEPPDAAAARLAPIPLLIVHGDADPLFPVTHARALYAAAGEPRHLWIESGFGHAEDAASPDLVARIGRWLVDTAGAPGPPTHPSR
jgi:pimeloyl-ACP methyl ester carboxylesterase